CLSSLAAPPPRPPLSPYPTLFRSPPRRADQRSRHREHPLARGVPAELRRLSHRDQPRSALPERGDDEDRRHRLRDDHRLPGQLRSEEHTSELQSRENLVCRLLLEK